jgi:hypothetical protein
MSRTSSRKTKVRELKGVKCDHCKVSVDALLCNLYTCCADPGCSKHCCQACAFQMDKSTAGAPDEVPSNTDIVCSSCASSTQKSNWWIMNPFKGTANKRQKQAAAVPVQQPKGAGPTAKVLVVVAVVADTESMNCFELALGC